MAVVTTSDYVVVGGKVDIYVSVPLASYVSPEWPFSPTRGSTPASNALAYVQMFKLGELEDDAEPRKRPIFNGVTGDRYGGSAGDSIEKQFMGYTYEIDLRLSRWDNEVYKLLQNHGGLTASTNSSIALSTYGALMLRDRSFRLLLVSNITTGLNRNFPCCLIEDSNSCGLGTKYSTLNLRVVAHRTPEGHWSDSSGTVGTSTSIGVVMNYDTTGTP